MSSAEEESVQGLSMNTLETVLIGGGTITGIIEMSAAGPNKIEWNALGVASFAAAALGVYLNYRRERSVGSGVDESTVTTTEREGS